MKLQQCPSCKHKVDIKQAAAVKNVNGILMLQCANCEQWSHENLSSAVVKNLGLLMLLIGSVMGYFQLGGILFGPLIAVSGGLTALIVTLWTSRIAATP